MKDELKKFNDSIEKWSDEDDDAEDAAWQQVLQRLEGKEIPEQAKELMRTIFGSGFAFALKHQAERMNALLRAVKADLKA